MAFSPFITDCAVTEALATKGRNCTLYTVVTTENYSSGASKLSCLRKLFTAGVQVRHLPTLHAKILLIPNCSVTVGSQNMTGGGMRNLEATYAWDDPRAARAVKKATDRWLIPTPRLVTATLLDDLEREVAKLRRQYAAWRKAANQASIDLWAAWQREVDRKRREREAEEARSKNRWRGEVERFASKVVQGRVVQHGDVWLLSNVGYSTDRPPSYRLWVIEGAKRTVGSGRKTWCPCYNLDSKQWGWARVYKSRISFIARDTFWRYHVTINKTRFRVQVSCLRPQDGGEWPNLLLEVKRDDIDDKAELLCHYEINSLHVESVRADDWEWNTASDFTPVPFQPLIDAVNSNEGGVQEQLLAIIHQRHEGIELSKSKRVDKMFTKGQEVFTGLRLVNSQEVLVFSTNRITASTGRA